MEKENATILEVAPGLATSPVPSFAVVQAWYSRIRGASTLDCGLALKLMAFCAEQGNGGFIADCSSWSSAKWHKTVGSCRPGQRENPFFAWANNGLRLYCYDASAARFPHGETSLVPSAAGTEKERRKEKEKQKEKGRKKEIALKRKLKETFPYPEDAQTVAELMQQRAGSGLPPDMLERCARDFLDIFTARGWVDARGQQVTDWRPCAAKFARSWADNLKHGFCPRSRRRSTNTRNENANKNHVQDYDHP